MTEPLSIQASDPRNLARVYKASPIGSQIVNSLTILIDQEIPECPSLDESRKLHAEQAEILVDALVEALPGGTFDALLIAMMQKKVSLFRVPFVEPKGDKNDE